VDLAAVLDEVEVDDAVQVVELVLEDAGQPALGLDPELLAVPPPGLDREGRRPGDGALPVGRGEAPLLVRDRLRAALDHLRVDQGVEGVLVLDHHHPQGDADLRRGQADAGGGAHGVDQVVEQALHGRVELAHALGLAAEDLVLQIGDDGTNGHTKVYPRGPARAGA
jgi:hypothetical protein